MDSFLDTTVIINNFEYEFSKEKLQKRCFEYLNNITGKIFISFIVKNEIERVILKKKEIYNQILSKIKDSSYEMDYKKSAYLKEEDVIIAKNIYLKLKKGNLKDIKDSFDFEIDFLNNSLDLFLKNKVNEIAITKQELEDSILSIIHNFIEDFADCRVLTSAIQIQQNKETFFFVTADKHFDSHGYNFIKTEPKFEKYRFPILKNLLYEN